MQFTHSPQRPEAKAMNTASINDLPIIEAARKFQWNGARRPDDHPSLSELSL